MLIVGESGTGKELVAAALHRHSDLAAAALFIRVNCGAAARGLRSKASYSGTSEAVVHRQRRPTAARPILNMPAGGTIFLDEVGGAAAIGRRPRSSACSSSMSSERFAEPGAVLAPTPASSPLLIAICKEVAAGRFREDLYYRLNVARIIIPPLRDRPVDIPILAEYILRRVERRHGWGELSLSSEALAAISERPWPGNVRQLENALARAAIAARGRAILPEHLDADELSDLSFPVVVDSTEHVPLRALLAEVERRAIARALAACNGNRTRTAERLGISRRQLFDKIREYDLHP